MKEHNNHEKKKNEIRFEEVNVMREEIDSLEDAFAPTTGIWCKGCKQKKQWGIVCG